MLFLCNEILRQVLGHSHYFVCSAALSQQLRTKIESSGQRAQGGGDIAVSDLDRLSQNVPAGPKPAYQLLANDDVVGIILLSEFAAQQYRNTGGLEVALANDMPQSIARALSATRKSHARIAGHRHWNGVCETRGRHRRQPLHSIQQLLKECRGL